MKKSLIFLVMIQSFFSLCAEGVLDTSFNTGGPVPGVVQTSVDASTNTIWGAVPQRNGKLVIVGQSDTSTNGAIIVARYNTDGTLDTTFNASGVMPGTRTLNGAGGTPSLFASSAVVRPGRLASAHTGCSIVIGGVVNPGVTSDWGIVRLNNDGTIDTSFGINGRVTVALSAGQDVLAEVVRLKNGKILAVGTADLNVNAAYTVVCLDKDGQLDSSFGIPSPPIYGIPYTSGVSAMTVLADPGTLVRSCVLLRNGNLLVFGQTQGATKDAALICFDSKGKIDTNFGTGGLASLNMNVPGNEDLFEILSFIRGKIILVSGVASGVKLVCLNSDGSVDTSFGTNGEITTIIGADNTFHAATLLSDGKIVVGGQTSASGGSFILARLNVDGTLDTTFGVAGIITIAVSAAADCIEALVTQPGGIITAVGSSDAQDKFALVRYTIPQTMFDSLRDKFLASEIHNIN